MAKWPKQSAWDAAVQATAAAALGGAAENGGTGWGGGNSWGGNQSSAAAADNGAGEAETNAWSKWQKRSATDNADAWQQGADLWGAGAGGSADAWPKPTGKHYWETQKYNIEWGILSRKDETTLQKDDEELFRDRLGDPAGLDFTRYDTIPVEVSGEGSHLIPACVSFNDMFQKFGGYVVTELIHKVQRCKYSVPTPVQKYAIPVGLVGRDVMCCAQTGSGKTAAFLIPIIGRMMLRHTDPVGVLDVPFEGAVRPDTLIMAPTRELTIQLHEEDLYAQDWAKHECRDLEQYNMEASVGEDGDEPSLSAVGEGFVDEYGDEPSPSASGEEQADTLDAVYSQEWTCGRLPK